MTIRQLDILGYRGFESKESLKPAVPTENRPGSGLTLLVGSNNSGKSTIAETLRFFSVHEAPSFSEGRRNKKAGDMVDIRIEETDGHVRHIRTFLKGSEAAMEQSAPARGALELHGLPSRRYFNPFFGGRHEMNRQQFSSSSAHSQRAFVLNDFPHRLMRIHKNHRKQFDDVLRRIVDPVPDWTVEMADQGNWYIKLAAASGFHNSEGMGEGLISLLFLIDALYDSTAGGIIVIDEPELSLHPSFQRKLADLLVEYSADRQIICATHSPYFPTIEALSGGAAIARVFVDQSGSHIAHLSEASAKNLVRLSLDQNNPHVFGLDAREVFFLPDQVILVEGQDDVLGYKRIAAELGMSIAGSFYGWGVGGADKMRMIATVLSDLRYKRVIGILDADKEKVAAQLRKEFADYRFFTMPTDDLRTRSAASRPAKVGVLDENGHVRPQHIVAMTKLFEDANKALT